MNEILGILIPMLMSGAGIGDIIRAIGGSGTGAAGMDGLDYMMTTQRRNARMSSLFTQNQDTINRASESVLDRLGVNPYSGLGQGLSSFLGSMYHVAPDTIGSILGVPNGGQFFGTVSNSAAAISQASGGGMPDIFNPYSVLDSFRRTSGMARQVYDLGMRRDANGKVTGGYDISFGHGLNMGEMGKVTQRLLTSRLPYQAYAENERGELDFSNETGERLDPTQAADAEKFNKNLKQLGSKFNEAAAMLSKVTGSVEEALNVMDRLGGGNFLGGTAEQASDVANKAKRMATAIRITSAVAGISPQEAYQNMSNLQQSMAAGMGLSPYTAKASGALGLTQDMAFNGTMAFNAWAAMNPNASPAQREQALFAANSRSQLYASSNGARFAAAVADNARSFTPEQLDQVKTALREGRPDDVKKMVRDVIGTNVFDAYMEDDATAFAARDRASKENRDLLNDLDVAGASGNYEQAERYGVDRFVGMTISDLNETVTKATGKSGFGRDVDEAAKASLQKLAMAQGLPEENVKNMKIGELRRFLGNRMGAGEVERSENIARVQAATEQIDSRTMTADEEQGARQRLKDSIASSSDWTDEGKQELIQRIDKGENLSAVYASYSDGLSSEASEELRDRIFGGKMTSDDATREKTKLQRLNRALKTDFTAKERLDAIEDNVKRSNLENVGKLKGLIPSEGFKDLDAGTAMGQFAAHVQNLREKGVVDTGGDNEALDQTYATATERVVANVFENGDGQGFIGKMKGDDLKKFQSQIAQQMTQLMRSGKAKTVREAFAQSFDTKNLTKEQIAAIAGVDVADVEKMSQEDIAKLGGVKALEGFKKQALDKGSNISTQKLSNEALFSASASVLDEKTRGNKTGAVDEMRKLAAGEFGDLNDEQAVNRFLELSKSIGIQADFSQDEVQTMLYNAQGAGDGKDAGKSVIESLLKRMQTKGRNDAGSFYGMVGAKDVNAAATVKATTETNLNMTSPKFSDEQTNQVSKTDDIRADSVRNRIPNAFGVGTASYFQEAVEGTKTEIGYLRDALDKGGVSMETMKASFGTGKDAEEARAKVENALKGHDKTKLDVSHGMSMLETLHASKIGGQEGLDVLMNQDVMSKALQQKGSDVDLVDVEKKANLKDSQGGGILNQVGAMLREFAPILANPQLIFHVKIADDQVPLSTR